MKNCSNHDSSNIKETKNCLSDDEEFYEEETAKKLFIGKKADYYIKKWNEGKEKNGQSLNIPAFAFSIFWLGYRKMYLPVILSSLSFLFFDIILYLIGYEQSLASFSPIDRAINIAVGVIFGLFGNLLYEKHVDKQIQKIDDSINDKEERKKQYRKKGGTSWLGILGALLIFLFLYILPTSFIPINVDPVEEIQYSKLEYYNKGEEESVSINKMFSNIFVDNEWTEESSSSTTENIVNFKGKHDNKNFDITFKLTEDTDQIEIIDFLIDEKDISYYTNLHPYDFLLTLYD